MSFLLLRLGRSTAAHPWRTLSAWLLVAGVLFGLAAVGGGTPQDDYDIPGARAQRGIDLLRDHTPSAGDASAHVVVHTRDGSPVPTATITGLTKRLDAMEHVVSVLPPRLSADRDTALLGVQYDVPVTDTDLMGNLDPLDRAVAPTRETEVQVELGGEVPDSAAAPMRGTGELVGVVAALLILVLAFGSVVGSGLPVAVALVGLAVGSAGIALLAAVTDVSTTAPVVASMVALGVGIDYALLLTTRFVEFLRNGRGAAEAAGLATASAGRSVVFASATVLVSLLGLKLAGLPTYDSFGYATAIAVVAVAGAALTLVPALCGLAGRRLLPRRVRRGRERTGTRLMERWAVRVSRRPVAWALASLVLLLSLAAPALAMRTWPQDSSAQPQDLTTRRAHDLVAADFGPGANGAVTVVAEADRVGASEFAVLARTLGARTDIATVTPVVTSPDGALRIFEAEPAFGPTDERVPALVAGLREAAPAGVEITGTVPVFADIATMLGTRLWLVVGFVVAVSMLLLGMVFRSVVVPVKAAVMNLLSIGAAYGVLTAVFQWGWGAGLLGLDHSMPISSWLPILLFAVLFGLSMDYEVFLLSRIREDWLDTGDPHGSVARGLASTGRVISCAAAIMVAVFLGFASEVDVVVKQLGIGMAVAITLDATLVRMVLVPATMTMLGRWNWWMPSWLDRALPTLHAEAADLEPTTTRTPAGV